MGLVLMTMLMMTSCVVGQDINNCTDCYTKQCLSVGDAAISAVDRSVNPCDNFYKYACGGWLQSPFLTPNERESVEVIDTVEPLGATIKLLSQGFKNGDPDAVKKAKNLFKSCQNSVYGYGNTISNIVTDLFGTWPISCVQCNISVYNLERSLIEMTRLGAHPLFTLSARVDHLDYKVTTKTFKRYLHIGEPTLRMSRRDYLDLSKSRLLTLNYKLMIITSALNIVPTYDSEQSNYWLVHDNVMGIVNVETEITRRMHENQGNLTKSNLGSIDQNYGQLMNWTRYMNELASTRDTNLGKITRHEIIFVEHPSALTSVINYFLGLPIRTQVNYLIWRLFDTLQNARIKPEDKLHAIYRFGFEDHKNVAYRDEPCAWFVTQTLPLAVQRLLYAEYLTQETVKMVNSMLQQMKYAFNDLLGSHNWLDKNAKRFIKEKIDSVTAVVANYFQVMDDQFLDSYYSRVAINSTHEYIEPDFSYQVAMVKKEAFIRNFRSIKLPAKMDFDQPPHVVSAQLATRIHEIVLSFAAVFHPWFMVQAPMAVNYAGAVHTLAYALVKSVYPKAMRRHRNGIEISDATEAAFDEIARCFLFQYYSYPFSSHIDDLSVVSDFIIADNVALKLAFKAYSNYSNTATTKRYNIAYSGFTNDQLFFVRAAQLMCNKGLVEPVEGIFSDPTYLEFRVNQALQNSLDFAYVFDCPCGSPMNPDVKCEMF